MINSLWIAKIGMSAQQTQLDVISHNLANVSTTGYKRNNAVFEDLIYQNQRQVGANTTEQNQLPTGLHLGLGVRTVATSRNFVQGSLQESKNNLDVAINGAGFFELTMPNGSTAYSRAGMFKLNDQGEIVNHQGAQLMGYPTDPEGNRLSFDTVPLTLPTSAPIPAQRTTNVTAEFNLDARAPVWNSVTPPTAISPESTKPRLVLASSV